MAKKPESRLQLRIKKRLIAEVGGKWFKVHGGPFQEAGLPDLIGCVEGLFFGFEVKLPFDPKSKPSELQLAVIKEYNDEGGYVCIVTSPEQAIAVVRAALAETKTRRFGRRLREWLCLVLRSADGEDVGYLWGYGAPPKRARANRRTQNKPRKHVAKQSPELAAALQSLLQD